MAQVSNNLVVKNYEKGQILLVSLLILVVALTVGLSVATRTITTIRMTTAEDSSQRAFSAAEAGIERALTASSNYTYTGDLSNNASFKVETNTVSGDNMVLNNGGSISKDDSVDVWLSNYPDYTTPWTGNITFYWGSPSDACVDVPESSNSMAALEVVLISGTKAAPTIDHYAFDPCNSGNTITNTNNKDRTSGSVGNHFSTNITYSSTIIGNKTFTYSASIPVTSGLLARLIPLYAKTYAAVSGTSLPPQGILITSTGSSGGTKRKIISFKSYPKVPVEFYPFLIFSTK